MLVFSFLYLYLSHRITDSCQQLKASAYINNGNLTIFFDKSDDM